MTILRPLLLSLTLLVSNLWAQGGAQSSTASMRINVGDPGIENQWHLQASAGTRLETLDTEMGIFREKFSVRTLSRRGDQISFQLPVKAGTKSPRLAGLEGKPAHVYKLTSQKPLGATVVEVAARAVEDSSRVTFFASADGRKWQRCGQFDNTRQNNISQSLANIPFQFVDLTPAVHGLTSFYLKMELAMNSADHRFCVAKLRVATEKNP